MKKIAVIGSGISGLVSALLLSKKYDVSLFEANDRIGGHTQTVDVTVSGAHYAIDTGFIVFNQKTYPLFCQLLRQYQIPTLESEMSFSYRSDAKNLEYNGHSLNTLFADRRNIFRLRFYTFLKEIMRFNKDAKAFLNGSLSSEVTIQEFINKYRYSQAFIEEYFIPMMAAIWSKSEADVLQSSAMFILQFYANHGLLDVYQRPQWYVIAGGSRSYIPAFIKPYEKNIHLNCKIESVKRQANSVILQSASAEFEVEAVVIATHSDEALKMLSDASDDEQAILSAIHYTKNEVILHTDASILPRRRLAWASWNYFATAQTAPTLTYYMNRLQSIRSETDFCVSVNLSGVIDTAKVLRRFSYAHPCFTQPAIAAQQQHARINGVRNTYYAGAYWGYGFHEDGVRSAVMACQPLGVNL